MATHLAWQEWPHPSIQPMGRSQITIDDTRLIETGAHQIVAKGGIFKHQNELFQSFDGLNGAYQACCLRTSVAEWFYTTHVTTREATATQATTAQTTFSTKKLQSSAANLARSLLYEF